MSRPLRRVTALLVATVTIAGCSSASSGPGGPQLSVTPPSATVRTGATEQFSAADATAAVSWGLEETGTSSPEPVYPLKVAPGGRYLVDQRDQPWRVQADAAWIMSSEATPDQVDSYLKTRRAQGFNSFYLMAMVHPGGYQAAKHAPNDLEGDPPFAAPGNFATAGGSAASERYWSWIDTIIDKAAAQHMVVMLAYTYLGYQGGNQGWYQEVLAQPSRQSLSDWGQWLGNRYKNKPNLIWFGLGDYTPPDGSEGALRARAIADGIKAAGATQLFMAEPSGPDQIPSEVADFGTVVDQNSFYGYGPNGAGAVYETADRSWKISPARPAWMEEGTYEYENNTGHFSTQPWATRRGRFWSVLAGGVAGDGFGSRDVWQWKDLAKSLASPGGSYSTYAFDLFGSLPWWTLVPSGTDPGYAGIKLVPSGQGTWGAADAITSAITEAREWLIAYVPVTEHGARTFTVEMGAMVGPTRARWFDPATGNYLAISEGYAYPNSGTREFTTPGKRDDGTDDWVLVLDSGNDARCGTISASGLYTAPTRVPSGVTCSVTAAPRSHPSDVARASVTLG